MNPKIFTGTKAVVEAVGGTVAITITGIIIALFIALSACGFCWPWCVSPQSIVSKYGSQFRGNSQHDALEFLLWLLDRVHEDANPTNNNNSKAKASAMVGNALWEYPVFPFLALFQC